LVGATTPSYDLETEIDETFPFNHIDETLINQILPQFLGEIDQKPPVFSAIKKDGIRMYEHARAGDRNGNGKLEKPPFMNLKLPELIYLKLILEWFAAKELTFVR
jgi:hypothetical protein